MRPHVLEFGATVLGGRLRLHCTYSRNLHDAATIENLIKNTLDAMRQTTDQSPQASQLSKESSFDEYSLASLRQEVLAELNSSER
jgi:hypothetical protein